MKVQFKITYEAFLVKKVNEKGVKVKTNFFKLKFLNLKAKKRLDFLCLMIGLKVCCV